jgi:stage V sporulation protein G
MRITKVRIVRLDGETRLAFAEITLDDCFRVRGLEIVRHQGGVAVKMPEAKLKGGVIGEVAFALNAQTRRMIEDAVIVEYEKVARRRNGKSR